MMSPQQDKVEKEKRNKILGSGEMDVGRGEVSNYLFWKIWREKVHKTYGYGDFEKATKS